MLDAVRVIRRGKEEMSREKERAIEFASTESANSGALLSQFGRKKLIKEREPWQNTVAMRGTGIPFSAIQFFSSWSGLKQKSAPRTHDGEGSAISERR